MSLVVEIAILALLVVTALTITRLRGLFATVMLTGIYSLLGAAWMLLLDAPDVAMTEAAVGAGVSTVLMLATLSLTASVDRPGGTPRVLPFLVVVATGAALVYGTADMPAVGDPTSPAATSPVTRHYLEAQTDEIGVPNIITAVLGSYRGYDTLGETSVILTAGIGVVLLIGGRARRRRDAPPVEASATTEPGRSPAPEMETVP